MKIKDMHRILVGLIARHLRITVKKAWKRLSVLRNTGNDYDVISYDEGVAVVEWLGSRPLDGEVRGSNPAQGRNLKTKISVSGAAQRWWRRVARAGWG